VPPSIIIPPGTPGKDRDSAAYSSRGRAGTARLSGPAAATTILMRWGGNQMRRSCASSYGSGGGGSGSTGREGKEAASFHLAAIDA
jgi:hypothetical protein